MEIRGDVTDTGQPTNQQGKIALLTTQFLFWETLSLANSCSHPDLTQWNCSALKTAFFKHLV